MSSHVPDPLASPATSASPWNLPNGLTLLRIALVPVFLWLLLSDHGDSTGLRIWAAVVFTVASWTDLLDGELARRQQLVTDFGKVADPIADKALMGAALIGLSLLGELPWWVSVVILAREAGVTLLRFWVIRLGVIPASRGGKAKTLLQGLGLFLLILPLPGLWHTIGLIVMYAAVAVTVLTGVDYLFRALRLRREAS